MPHKNTKNEAKTWKTRTKFPAGGVWAKITITLTKFYLQIGPRCCSSPHRHVELNNSHREVWDKTHSHVRDRSLHVQVRQCVTVTCHGKQRTRASEDQDSWKWPMPDERLFELKYCRKLGKKLRQFEFPSARSFILNILIHCFTFITFITTRVVIN